MKYYYLNGLDKLGPYTLEEIKTRNLSLDTMILREDKSSWLALYEFEELKVLIIEANEEAVSPIEENKSIVKDEKVVHAGKKSYKLLAIGSLLLILSIIAYFAYQHFSLNEDLARKSSSRFFKMLSIDNPDFAEIEKLYPNFNLIGTRLKLVQQCKIDNISRNSEGDYEVYASYPLDKNKSKIASIYLLISKNSSGVYIKSSKGLSYACFDRVLEYGKSKGCLTGSEDDVQMGAIIKEKGLRIDLEYDTDIKIKSLHSNLKKSDNIKREYGMISGNVTITNNNDIDFGYFDLECSVEFYNAKGQITSVEQVYGINEIKAYSSASGRVFSSSKNSTNYKIITTIKSSGDIVNKLKNKIIENTVYDCK